MTTSTSVEIRLMAALISFVTCGITCTVLPRSRSVSAPSSVTKTSPCWNGLSVPGSTFRYGSNFCRLTRSPRLSSRHPIDDAAIPLPSDETTPPVTKMYLAILNHPRQSSFKQLVHPFQVVWRVHAYGFICRFDHADLVPV